jgi:hypothetical protein
MLSVSVEFASYDRVDLSRIKDINIKTYRNRKQMGIYFTLFEIKVNKSVTQKRQLR